MAENRGGSRQGKQGKPHPNRSDLNQAKVVAKGQPYGQAGQQEQALSAVPLRNSATPLSNNREPRDDLRGKIPTLAQPSMRPDEPVTAGLPLGGGAGPEALALGTAANKELAIYRALFLRYPSEDLRRMIEFMEANL